MRLPRRIRSSVGARWLVVASVAAALAACGDDADTADAPSVEAIDHVHGLGVNPADRSLMIATHSGLFRAPDDTTQAERVGTSSQDTMGFTIVGADRFLGSGHPGPGEEGPPNLGLIESTDAGETWHEVSMGGEADLHVLRYAHERIYAINALSGLLLLSEDGGQSWTERVPPSGVFDLSVDPADPRRIVAATEGGLKLSEDDGRNWRDLSRKVGLLAWPDSKRLYLIDGTGEAHVSRNGGNGWNVVGRIGAQPVALAAAGNQELYAALGDGTVLASTDGGASWQARVSP